MHSENVIAIVDNDRPSREQLARLVATFGYRVQSFPSGAAFLDSAQLHPPCCAVLDTRTEKLSGLAGATAHRRPVARDDDRVRIGKQ